MSSEPGWDAARASDIIGAHVGQPGALLPILHALQDAFGHIDDRAVPAVAQALNLTRAEVHGVVSFYHHFRHAPPGRHVLKLCRAEACQAMGGEAIASDLMARLELAWNETTADGALTIEPVFCLGLCATAPAALLDERPIGRLTAARLDAVLEHCPS